MFGSFIAATVRVVTSPLDMLNATADIMTGGTGSKASRMDGGLLSEMEDARDDIAENIEKMDDEL